MSRADTSTEYEDEGGQSFDFARAYSAVRRRWLWILSIMLTCMVISSTIALMLPNKYEASSVIQLDPRRKPLTNLEGIINELKADAATIESEVEIIRSLDIARRVIEVLNLRDDPEFTATGTDIKSYFTGFISDLSENEMGNASNKTARQKVSQEQQKTTSDLALKLSYQVPKEFKAGHSRRDEIAVAFIKRLSVKRVRTTFLIEIKFTSQDPVKAAKIATTIAEVYLAEQIRKKSEATRLASTLLEQKISQFKNKVDRAERKVSQFKIDHGIFSSEGHILSEKALARLMEQTINARNTTAQARSKYEQASDLRKTGEGNEALADVLKSHTVRLMKEKLADATRKRAELATRYGARHPQMQKVQAEVKDARARLDSEVGKEVTSLKNEFKQAEFREQQLISDLENSKNTEATGKQQSAELAQLEREAQTSRKLLEVLLGRYMQANESVNLQLPDARVVESADVPLLPGSPKRTKIVALATIGGLGLGIILALALEFATTGLGRPEDVEQVLDLAHLSSLPQLSKGPLQQEDPLTLARLMIAEPNGEFAEAIRSVRRELDVQRADNRPRIILVAGSLPGEGANVVASNIAHHYAMTGQSVLLMDGDVRRSKLSNQLAPQRQYGLMDALSRSFGAEKAILRDKLTNLHFLPATSSYSLPNTNPELLSSPAMAYQLTRLKKQFDIIVIASPPLLPVIDGRVLADYADQILFVMGWRSTPKALAKRALKGLAINEHKIVGVVVNHVDREMLPDNSSFASREPNGYVARERHAA